MISRPERWSSLDASIALRELGLDPVWHLSNRGRAVSDIEADIANPAAPAQIFRQLREKENRLDALINNAALQIVKPLIDTTPEEWDRTMASNVRSVYLSVRESHSLLQERGGAIVNISSVHAVATSAGLAAYVASKGALLSLTRAMALELGDDGIRVNAVLPGAVDTPMLHDGLSRGADHGAAGQRG